MNTTIETTGGNIGRLIRAYLWDNDALLKDGYDGDHGLSGHCYVASEAYYHLSGRSDELTVCRVNVDGVTHWFLEDESESSERFIDLTADQFDRSVPYDERTRTGFMTSEPSKRAHRVIEAVEALSDLNR